jgi:hypothetical protein
MKKLTIGLMAAFLTLTFIPVQSQASASMAETKSAEASKANALLTRMHAIKAMDKSKLTSTDKKQLRSEVQSIKSQMKEIGGGIYLSLGAIIIILLLLILLV